MNKLTVKAITASMISILSVLGMISFSANPNFSINPGTLTGKLHCEYRFTMVLNANNTGYNAFESTIRFDSGSAQITHESISSVFNNVTDASIKSGYLYNARGTMFAGQTSMATLTDALTFRFKTTQNITGTMLKFTTLSGDDIIFDQRITDDGANVNASGTSYDILSGVTHGYYTFLPLPCIPDTNNPIMGWNYPTNGAWMIPDNATISMVVYDWVGAGTAAGTPPMTNSNNRQHYRYSGNDTSVLANYVPAIPGVDNQEGVNSGSVNITVACPTCAGGLGRSYTFTPTDPSLTLTEWTGNSSINMLTWQNKIRGYRLSLPAPEPYEVEKQVNVSVSITDNPNENNQTHTGYPSFSFNTPQNPTISKIQPAGSTNIPLNFAPFVFTFNDTWAGIDTGSISITIPESGSGTKFYTGHTYSGNELTIVLTGGSPGLGNSGSYQVSFVPLWDFPSNATIIITGSVYDLAGNKGTYSSSFTTPLMCIDRGCADLFTVNILGGLSFAFTGYTIQITGMNSNIPPYLTGTNNDILMCGLPYSGTILTGNIGIYDTLGTSIKGTIFTGDTLYITGMDGLDFIYDNGIIIIN